MIDSRVCVGGGGKRVLEVEGVVWGKVWCCYMLEIRRGIMNYFFFEIEIGYKYYLVKFREKN